MKLIFIMVLMVDCSRMTYAAINLPDAFVLAPIQTPTEVGTIFPFLIKQIDGPLTATMPTIRYQQVYNWSLFTNLAPSLIYVTTLTFVIGSTNFVSGWSVPKMQINLSTTSRAADNLSPVFSQNAGQDDTIVFGPGSYNFPGGPGGNKLFFSKPFLYNPALGSLLLDVRILDGGGAPDQFNPSPRILAYDSPTDQVSRVWATNVASTTADVIDTLGFETVIQMSPAPSLAIYTYTNGSAVYTGIQWPTEPSTFALQRARVVGPGELWQNVSTAGVYSNYLFQELDFPASSAGTGAFYRLIWPGGQGQARVASSPVKPTPHQDAPPSESNVQRRENER